MKKQLKIIAIRPLKGCAEHILKVLKPGITYFLYNNYEMIDGDQFIRRKKEEVLPIDFFRQKENTPYISISAIVGKNGDGKSSLIELMIRVLNNFAKIYNFGGDTENLIYIKSINADLYFSVIGIDKDEETEDEKTKEDKNTEEDKDKKTVETVYKIAIRSNEREEIALYRQEEPLFVQSFDIHNNNPENISDSVDKLAEKKASFIADYFFTLVANYSLHAYNSYDYSDEWVWIKTNETTEKQVSWLDNIFHKNDGYQTPVVLHPFRKEGNIDVNIEQQLTTQRLLTLFLTTDTSKNSFRWVNDRQFAENMEYTLMENSILEEKVFYQFFRIYFYYDSFSDKSAPALQEISDKISELIEQDKPGIDSAFHKQVQKEILIPLEKMSAFIVDNKKVFRRAMQALKRLKADLKEEKDNSQAIDRQTDIQRFLSQVKEIIIGAKNILPPDTCNRIDQAVKAINKEVGELNFYQYFQIVLTLFIQNEWRKRIPHLETSINQLNEVEKDLGDKAFDYVVYKTLSIIRKYPQYKHCYRFCYFQGYLGNNAEITSFEKEGYEKAIQDILEDKSHITLKLRQILNLLNYDFYTKEAHAPTLYKNYIALFRLETEQDEEESQGQKLFTQKRVRRCSFTTYYNAIKDFCLQENGSIDTSKLIDFLPPPIFQSDAILTGGKKQEVSRLSGLSSGEKQLLSSVSSVLYHLRNLNSVIARHIKTIIDEKPIYQYEHINLIFEEIELYFHPEYQRKFIKYLIDRIGRIHLPKIQSINICLVTHSPFILSDIPVSNVLFLEEGRPQMKMKGTNINTFSANIYDLLEKGFFLEAPMGEFAATYIQKLINEINNINNRDNIHNNISHKHIRSKYESRINLVGDDFLRYELKYKLHQKLGDTKEMEILELERRIKELKGE